MSDDNYDKAMSAFDTILSKSFEKIILHATPTLRVNYFLNTAAQAMEKGIPIDWKKVEEYMNVNLSQYDTNLFRGFNSLEELFHIRTNVIIAEMGMGIWQTHECKDCHQKFHLSHGEVMFFKSKGLNVPARCKSCRDARKSK